MSKKSRRVAKARRALLALSLVLVTMLVAVGGTIAWLTDYTTPVTNTFSVGDIEITLQEHEYDDTKNELKDTTTTTGNENYKIVPGVDLPKDPYVTVAATSEACWLFVKIEETDWSNHLTYTLDKTTQPGATTAWAELADNPGVYFIKVDATGENPANFNILAKDEKGNSITVSNQIKKDEITGTPKLTFTAYACQQANVTDAATAWSNIQANLPTAP